MEKGDDQSRGSNYEVFTSVEEPPPKYDSLSYVGVKASSSPNKYRVLWLAIGLSVGVAVVVGIVTGVTVHLLGE